MRNFIPDFIQKQYLSGSNHDCITAYTMFIDLSGFTPLTETLMKKGTEGAEQLSISLNNIFAPMVSHVYQKGGFIPYFAGDAFTAVFPEEQKDFHAEDLLQTARQIRKLFSEGGLNKTEFGDFEIGIKIGLSHGEVEWGIVGDKYKTFYFRGDAIDDCAESEHRAKGQDIVLDHKLLQKFVGRRPDVEPIQTGYYRLIKDHNELEDITGEYVKVPIEKKVVKQFLPSEIIAFNGLGEFRTVVSVFISFTGVDNHEHFNEFSTIVLNEINNFSGYFKEVDFGDKGGVIVSFFGAPVSFENNNERALEFVSAIRENLQDLEASSNLKFRAGITTGLAYTGIVGGEERCQYAVVGNRVNLAARLMMNATWGEVQVDSDIRKQRSFKFDNKGDISYKGIEGRIPTFVLKGRNIEDRIVFDGLMIGRSQELKHLIDFASPLIEGQFVGIIYVYGEAGIGKSRLTYELKQSLKDKGNIEWITCQADQILQKPFNPFIYFLKNEFEQSSENSPAVNLSIFEKNFKWLLDDSAQLEGPEGKLIHRELIRTRSILAALIGLNLEDSIWLQLDAKGRYQNTLQALANLFKAKARLAPLVIELEDGHWYDNNSKEFLEDFVRQISNFPILLLVTSRYTDDGAKPVLIEEETLGKYQVQVNHLDLNILSKESLLEFAEVKMDGKIHKELYELLQRTTNGNPFYLEQILEYFVESNLLELKEDYWHIKDKSIKVSSSINAILMARVDRLSTLVKETVKAAAVIGREFEIPVLSEVMKGHEDFIRRNGNSNVVLKEQVRTAEQGQIWQAMNELRYIFKHSLLREAVYSMQLGTHLRRLHHLIAEAIEKIYEKNIEERYVDLAFHYGQAAVKGKTKEYLFRAANYARRNFQNRQALDFYSKLLDNLGEDDAVAERIDVMLKKGKVLKLIGQWDLCEEVFDEAKSMALESGDKLLIGRTHNSLGHMLMLKGNYEMADHCLEKASSLFEEIDDSLGISKVNGNLGNLYFRQGKYEKAKLFFRRSIAVSDAKGLRTDPQIVSNLGLTHMNQGDYDEGINCQLVALKDSERANDKPGMAILNTNLGIVYFEKGEYDSALDCYEKGLEFSEELGNKLLTSIAIGCIGSVYQRKGDYETAMQHFVRDLELCEELGDKQGMAIAIGLIGELRSVEGDFDVAIEYLKRNLELCQELGYQKGIAKAVNTLGDIYAFRGEYEVSINYYNQAIEISRQINNKLVLGFSLAEKGMTLMLKGDYKEAHEMHLEALEIAESLGNPDLIFEALILSARVAYFAGNASVARKTLEDMLADTKDPKEMADIHYELYKFSPAGNIHQQKAFDLYQDLYKTETRYIYGERIKELAALD